VSQSLRIVFRKSGRAGQELRLDTPVVRLGREFGSDVQFDEAADRAVSRRHAEIRWEKDRPFLHPIGGKLVARAGVALTAPTPIAQGDIFEFAGVGGPSIQVWYDEDGQGADEAPTPPETPVMAPPTLTPLQVEPAAATESDAAPDEDEVTPTEIETSRSKPPSRAPAAPPKPAARPPPPPSAAVAPLRAAPRPPPPPHAAVAPLRAARPPTQPAVAPVAAPPPSPAPAAASPAAPPAAAAPAVSSPAHPPVPAPSPAAAPVAPAPAAVQPARQAKVLTPAKPPSVLSPGRPSALATGSKATATPAGCRARVIGGSLDGQVFAIGSGGLVIGRTPSCQVRFDSAQDPSVEPRHCLLHVLKGRVYCDDLGSSGGVFIDGQRKTHTEVHEGQRVTLGQAGPALVLEGSAGQAVAEPDDEMMRATQIEMPAFLAAPAAAPAAAPEAEPVTDQIEPELVTDQMSVPAPSEETTIPGREAPEITPTAVPGPVAKAAAEAGSGPKAAPATPAKAAPLAPPKAPPRTPTPAGQAPALPPAAKPAAPARPAPRGEHHATQILMEPLQAGLPPLAPDGTGHTQFMMQPIEAVAPPKRRWKLWAAVATSSLIALGGVGAGIHTWQKAEKRRRVIAKVERKKQALQADRAGEEITVEEWELYGAVRRSEGKAIEPELRRVVPVQMQAQVAPPTGPTPEELARKAAEEAERKRKEAEAAAAAAAEAKRIAEERAKIAIGVRDAFANLRRTELERLKIARSAKAGGPNRARFVMLGEKRRDLVAAYDAEAVKLKPDAAPSKTEQLMRRVARNLGEEPASVPERFLAQAKQAVDKRLKDKPLREAMLSGLQRAKDEHLAETVTAALADQGLPVEFLFIALELSGADPKAVGSDSGTGVPKGMFQLIPEAASKVGINPGPLASQPLFDDADGRAHYEVESKGVAKHLRQQFFGGAGGSALLVAATFANGDPMMLSAVRAKLGAKGEDPGATSFWRAWEADALPPPAREAALRFFALAVVLNDPSAFSLGIAPPLEHVALAEGME